MPISGTWKAQRAIFVESDLIGYMRPVAPGEHDYDDSDYGDGRANFNAPTYQETGPASWYDNFRALPPEEPTEWAPRTHEGTGGPYLPPDNPVTGDVGTPDPGHAVRTGRPEVAHQIGMLPNEHYQVDDVMGPPVPTPLSTEYNCGPYTLGLDGRPSNNESQAGRGNNGFNRPDQAQSWTEAVPLRYGVPYVTERVTLPFQDMRWTHDERTSLPNVAAQPGNAPGVGSDIPPGNSPMVFPRLQRFLGQYGTPVVVRDAPASMDDVVSVVEEPAPSTGWAW